MKNDIVWGIIGGLAAVLFTSYFMGCSPAKVKSGTEIGCNVIEAFTDDKIVESICATAPELASLAAEIIASRMATRADSGTDGGSPRGTTACKVIPGAAICATNEETLVAIRSLKAAR